jgi:hypothetical protein
MLVFFTNIFYIVDHKTTYGELFTYRLFLKVISYKSATCLCRQAGATADGQSTNAWQQITLPLLLFSTTTIFSSNPILQKPLTGPKPPSGFLQPMLVFFTNIFYIVGQKTNYGGIVGRKTNDGATFQSNKSELR